MNAVPPPMGANLTVAMASRRVELAPSPPAPLPEALAEDGDCAAEGGDAQHASDGGDERVTERLGDAPERGARSGYRRRPRGEGPGNPGTHPRPAVPG